MKKFISKSLLLTLITFASISGIQAQENAKKQTPLDAFAMLPTITQATLSNDGKQLAFLRSTSKTGGYIIEVRQVDDLKKKPVTFGADRMTISGFTWLNNEKLGVYFSQKLKDGNETYWVSKFAIVNSDGTGKWEIPFKKDNRASFSLVSTLPDVKNEVLINYDVNKNYYPDVVRYNIINGRTKTVLRGNSKRYEGFVADKDGEVRVAGGYNRADKSFDFYARIKGDSDWKLVNQNFATDRENYNFIGFSAENYNEIYVNANLGEDKTGVYLYNLETGKHSERLFGISKVDTDGIIVSRKKANYGELLGYRYTTKHPVQYYTNDKEGKFVNGIKALFPDKYVSLQSRSEDDNNIVIKTTSGKDPGTFYLLRDKNKLEKIAEQYPLLDEDDLSKVKYISYKARDGRKIPAYVTIPKGKKPFPTVVMPHGGPWVRDVVIYDEWAQLLANHGYLVIQPQYRGSTGFGLDHWRVADKQWGLTMQDDLDDAALFLVKKGLANTDKLALFGWSYGGYAAFAGSMRENNIYQCAIAGAGVADLNRVNSTISTPFGRVRQRPTIAGVSPIDHVDKVNVPILVVHGDLDKIVPIKHSRDFIDELEEHKKDYKYVEFEGLGHKSFMFTYEDKIKFYSELLNWLDTKCG